MKKSNASSQAISQAKSFGNNLLTTILLMIPGLAGGLTGAGLGRWGLIVGGGLMTLARVKSWPLWLQAFSYGVALVGVTTIQPLSKQGQQAVNNANDEGDLSGLLMFDNSAISRMEHYATQIGRALFLDRIPGLNKAMGLAGMPSMQTYVPRYQPYGDPAMLPAYSQPTTAMAGINTDAAELLERKSLSGTDGQYLEERRRGRRASY